MAAVQWILCILRYASIEVQGSSRWFSSLSMNYFQVVWFMTLC